MRPNRKRTLQEVKTNTPSKIIRAQVYYHMGGMNYFTGEVEKRGLYLSVMPVEVGDGFESFTAFSGYKHCVVEMDRFSQKELDNYHVDGVLLRKMVERVMIENRLGEPQ